MPWLETNVDDQRMQFVLAVTRAPRQMRATCARFGISRKTGYKWLRRYRAAGSLAGVGAHSRRPHRSPRRTSPALTARVVALRRQFGWSGPKLTVLLAREGRVVSPATVDRIIRREGLVAPRDEQRPAVQRFERAAPNELWQLDAKGAYPLATGGVCHPVALLDDHSRFAVGLTGVRRLTVAPVQAWFVGCFERYGVPDALLMDHGVPWWAPHNGHGLTRLSVFLLDQGIRLLHGRVRHPQTQGKVERFHRTVGARLRFWHTPYEWEPLQAAFRAFQTEYNHVRPHAALGQQPPARRYQPSQRAYQPTPPPWPYPPGSACQTVDASGSIALAGRRYFVSHALAGARVGCAPYDDGRLLVTYRHMHIRDIDLRTGRTVPLVCSVGDEVSPMS